MRAESDSNAVTSQPQPISHFESVTHSYRLLWIVNLEPRSGEYSGAGLRFINFARELTRSGVAVFFVVNCWPSDDIGEMRDFLSSLERQSVIQGFLITEYSYPRWRGRLGALAFHPGLTDWLMKAVRRGTITRLRSFAEAKRINVCIASDRKLLFAGAALLQALPVVFDWTDSLVLYYLRALRRRLRCRKLRGICGFLRDFQTNLIAEAYYGHRAVLNMIVSPVDQRWLGRTNWCASKNRLIMNGAKPPSSGAQKIPKRLIFSGAMDFAPNYEGAIWFLDNVFPLVLRKHPDAHLVLVGMNPVQELVERASEQVCITGFVQDIGTEIARSSLYVSPLITGSGFKNKIIEAILNGTYVVGTPMSFEFLDVELQHLLTVAESAEEMAGAVTDFLDDPRQFDSRLSELQSRMTSCFSWVARGADLLQLLKEAYSLYFNQKPSLGKPRTADTLTTSD